MRWIKKKLYAMHWWLSDRITPGLRDAQHTYLGAVDRAVFPGAHWMDLGCGHRIVPRWMTCADERQARLVTRAGRLVGVDVDRPSLEKNRVHRELMHADLARLPVPDASFDVVTANMVVEHLADPAAVMAEVARVLRPGGEFVFHTPNLLSPFTFLMSPAPQFVKNMLAQTLEDRPAGDVFKTHYRCNRVRAVRNLAQKQGLVIRELKAHESAPETAALGPLVLPELLIIRAMRWGRLRHFRSNLIAVLQKPALHQSALAPTPVLRAA